MKIKSLSIALFVWMLAGSGCGPSEQTDEASPQENKDFYPVGAFISEELKMIDSLPIAVLLYREVDAQKDTQIIEKPAFRALAQQIAIPDISMEPLKKKYRETVYMDNTLNLVTMTYSTADPEMTIQKINVYIQPETNKVKSIFIEKRLPLGDSNRLMKMVWTGGKQLQVNSIESVPGKADRTMQEKYVWGMPQ